MSVSILDPAKLSLNILGCKVEGFSKGSFVTIVKDIPTFSTKTSMKGSKMVTRHRHSDYTLTFRLDNTASANTWLHSVYKLQELYGIVFPVPLIYLDKNGETSFFCVTGILEEPRVDQGDAVNPTEWKVICPKVMHTIGGSGKEAFVAQVLQTIANFLSVADFVGLDLSGIQGQAQGLLDKASSTIGGMFENFR